MREGSIERVVTIFPGAVGDLLLALPTLRRLRARMPEGVSTLVVAEPLRALARLAGVADVVESLDGAEAALLFGGSRLPAWLAPGAHVTSWLGSTDATLRARLQDHRCRFRFARVERGDATEHAAVAYHRAALDTGASHAELAALARLDVPAALPSDVPTRLRRPLLAVHAGAGAADKRWPVDGFRTLAAWWRGRGGDVLEIVGPADPDGGVLDGAPALRGHGLPAVAAALRAADLYLGNDTGPTHLAAAVGTPGVALFGPTDPQRWGPLGPAIVPLRGEPPGPLSCATLPPERVIDALRARFAGATHLDNPRTRD